MKEAVTPEEQALMQARVVREEQRHEEQEGFVTDVVCFEEDSTEKDNRCHRLPIFHIKQIDGVCYYACRRHSKTLVTELEDIPLGGSNAALQN